jgi:hypothetical protein
MYTLKHAANYKEVHHNKTSGVSTFQVMTAKNTFTREKKIRYHDDVFQILIIATKEILQIQSNLTGYDANINPDRPPKNFFTVQCLGKTRSYGQKLSTKNS